MQIDWEELGVTPEELRYEWEHPPTLERIEEIRKEIEEEHKEEYKELRKELEKAGIIGIK